MKKVQAIHIATLKPTTGILVENQNDLKGIKLHPFIEAGEPVFINSAGGYCDVKGTYRIIGREDLN